MCENIEKGSRQNESIFLPLEAHFRIVASNGAAADGVAIWYTRNLGTGTAWGAPSTFSGIGIVLDTYVNEIDGNRGHQSSRLFILFNSDLKEKEVDSNLDGSNMMFGEKCDLGKDAYSTITNRPRDANPTVKILVRYLMETLEVYYSIPSLYHKQWQFCTNFTGVFLPAHYHLGISAATGELRSIHELISFRV
ncbi:hypothetical protein KIN20_020374 [Parelaphostrongylus tenuis]|uniref:L-type lectin-like domain-containing protein n=1 Tax=Parelaphostrongylus tenuis TaxID=148309 RepID=A0AAD5QTG9_PARTN|nr:hypothetical protein KIN20_020374 [Parelaphostrongylus tenuis]